MNVNFTVSFDPKVLAQRYRRSLPFPVRARIASLARWARERGGCVFLVGGPVRDILLDVSGFDADLAVEGDVPALIRRARTEWGCKTREHAPFLTATLIFDDGSKIDLARTRTETYAREAVLPTVRPASLDEDLGRRDISVNAMALAVEERGFGPLIDPFGGWEDLRRGVARLLREKSLRDDPTRLFRVARFTGRLGLRIENQTARWMREAVEERLPEKLSAQRLFREFRLILAERDAVPALRILARFRAQGFIHQRLNLRPRVLGRVASLPVGGATEDAALPAVDLLSARASILTSDWPADDLRRLYVDLGLGVRAAELAIRDHDRMKPVEAALRETARLLPSETAATLDLLSDEALVILASQTKRPEVRQAVEAGFRERRNRPAVLGGDDLRALGHAPGPEMGATQRALRAVVIDGAARTRREQAAWVRRRLRDRPDLHVDSKNGSR